jgi:hypothetical protein
MINIIRLGKSRKISRKGHVTHKGGMTNTFGVLVEELSERSSLEGRRRMW